MSQWHQLDETAVVKELATDATRGLSDDEVERRRQQYGENELAEMGRRGPLLILWEQLRGALVLLLVAAAIVSVYLHEFIDAGAIMAIVVLNAILGFIQDYRAERALAALKKLAVPLVRVRRNGRLEERSSRELVPGDIVMLEAGNAIPADCRLLESINLKSQEAALTGESEAIEKRVGPLSGDHLPLGDRNNMAYMGTIVTYGHGQAVVTETGMNTELGHIARSLQTVKLERTPLQRRLSQLGRSLALVALAIVFALFAVGMLRGGQFKDMLMTALSLAVAIVPEGLPAVATVALALGAQQMFRRGALIRKLPAVETLGSVTVICSDKTGTLTENQMTVTVLDVAGQRIDLPLTEKKQASSGFTFVEATADAPTERRSSLAILLAGAALCNDAELEFDVTDDSYRAIGDPTEAALTVAAAEMGLPKNELERFLPRTDEIPFDSDRKRMTTLHRRVAADREGSSASGGLKVLLENVHEADYVAFTKGAVDQVLEVSRDVWVDQQPLPLDDPWRERIRLANEQLAGRGMRVLGVAFRPVDQVTSHDDIEHGLAFVGLLAMIDPPRPEVEEAVRKCCTAGIRPVMITGDHPLTALHIAHQLGIADDRTALTGEQLAQMSVSDLEEVVERTSVYARVAPKDKLHIVQALQNRGHVVAMTGDGVNDAPALKQAHIGVAMGITGTDVSKEASEMVLLDDNFATIVRAVERGRIVYDNIRKFVKYTMTSNAGEVFVMALGLLLDMPLPLLPLQILWVNLVTDGLPGLALAVEPAEKDIMQRPPIPPNEHIFGRGMVGDIAWIGLLMGGVSLAMGYANWSLDGRPPATVDSHDNWRTMVFTVLTLSQMGNALAIRSSRQSLFQIGLFSNMALLGSVLLTLLAQMAVVYLPALQTVFKTTALSARDLLMCLGLSTVVFAAVELQKLYLRRRNP